MMYRSLYHILLSTVIVFIACQSPKTDILEGKTANETPLFELLEPVESGITFINQLTEGPNTNVLMYEYFYNGGGVAIGDLNKDGLDDIYFTGNMVPNTLYLNKGNLKFDDITEKSGVSGREGPWTTGVTMADVNGDGWLDIYVCYSGNLPAEKRKNQLFINQGLNEEGLPFFEERAEEFGLDIDSFSTQALFFDFDLDGDLDMFLLNHNPKSLPVLDEYSTKDLLGKKDPAGSQLFRNDDGKFIEVTEAAGIQNSALSYGLGIGVADLSGNGYPDIYVSNDYTATDYLYFNNGNGTFTDRAQIALGHISQFSMGNELADFNNDGYVDIITLDMLPEDNRRQKLLMSPDNYEKHQFMVKVGLHHQYMRNMLHINQGNGRFSEIGQIAGISNTDWSWAALLADFDNDGWKDLFVSNGYRKDYTNLDFLKYMGDYVQNHRGNLKRDNILELVSNIPASDISNYIFRNNQNGGFQDVSSLWGLSKPVNSNGAAYADLDNDGDLELIINNVDAPAFIYKNNSQELQPNNWLQVELKGEGQNQYGVGTKIFLYEGENLQVQEQMPTRGYQSSVSYKMHFGLGEVSQLDSLVVYWPGGKTQVLKTINANSILLLEQKNGIKTDNLIQGKKQKTIFSNAGSFGDKIEPSAFNDFKRQSLIPHAISGSKLAMAKGDLNGDGLEDVFIGGLSGQAFQILYQNTKGQFKKAEVKGILEDALAIEDSDALIFDANLDGLMDIYVASGGYGDLSKDDERLQDRLYLNDGKGNFYWNKASLPKLLTPSSVVISNDINGDGYPDLFVGSGAVPGQFPIAASSYLLLNNQDGTFKDVTNAYFPELKEIGLIKDAQWIDLDGDSQNELVIVGEWMPISVFALKGQRFENVTSEYFQKEFTGWWKTLLVEDIGGQKVLIAGNYGLNSQIKASVQQPVELFYKDFDDNGSVDPILTSYIQGVSYPYLTRDELLDQFIHKRSKFTSYESYANAGLKDIFTEEELLGVAHLKASYLETKMFIQGNQGYFEEISLPQEVQYAPVYKIVLIENEDENYLLFLGNEEKARLRIGKQDANHGILVSLQQVNSPKYIPQNKSGFNLTGESRNALKIGKNKVVVHVMGEAPLVYEK